MAVVQTLDDAVSFINSLYNSSSTPPTEGEEDYIDWTNKLNIAINIWENDQGILWNELFVKLADAPDGDKTTDGGNSYSVPTLFSFPCSSCVWLGSGNNKTLYKVIKQSEVQLVENDSSNWCYFLMDGTPTLEFNPNISIPTGQTISYNYYKKATELSTGSDTFEMSDPMFAVFYVLSELKKEEGNAQEVQMMSEKLKAMETRNEMPAWFQEEVNHGFITPLGD